MREILNKIVGGRYYVLEFLGKGGFSEVYKVRDIQNGNYFALKQYITSDPANKKRLLEGMEKELNVLKNTSHPVLPKIYNIIKEEDKFFLIMEYVEGINLKEYVREKGILKKQLLIPIIFQVCSGLYYLHSMEPPVVYRDLKPSNIMFMENQGIKLIDFGIAKRYNREIDADELALGSRGFAAPEQFGNKKGTGIYNTDIRSDIYGVGTTMYYLATGRFYHGKRSLRQFRFRRLTPGIKKIIIKCTQINPDRRYQNCIELLCDVNRLRR